MGLGASGAGWCFFIGMENDLASEIVDTLSAHAAASTKGTSQSGEPLLHHRDNE